MENSQKKIRRALDYFSAPQLLMVGFASVILTGAVILMLPISVREGATVSFIDALFTSTSAVCVTGLIAIDTADHFTVFGRAVVAALIQIGGLGVTCVGVSLILAAGRKIDFHTRKLIKESWNIDSYQGLVKLVKQVLKLTFAFEVVGAVLSFLVFSQDYSFWDAWGISIFHSIAAFNNSGFDILGNLQNLIPYSDSILLNLVTAGLIICGGIGFLVILDIKKKKRFKKLTLHSKVVITMSIVLILVGTILLKSTENITWLQAFFHSVSARTAGFSTTPLGEFTNAGLFVLVILMFIGASPGSTGGGIKTSTFFVLITVFRGIVKNQPFGAFKRRISNKVIMQAFNVVFLSLMVVVIGTLLLCVTAPECTFIQILFEVTSAFGTVGLSTGITPYLNSISKYILILIMFIGRLGAMTVATKKKKKKPRTAVYSVEDISIG